MTQHTEKNLHSAVKELVLDRKSLLIIEAVQIVPYNSVSL